MFRRGYSGFTLIEFIIVIVLIGILAGVLTAVLSRPMLSYVTTERRAELVDRLDTALARMTREIRLALPYSLRVSGTNAVEFLRTFDGGRYREQGANRLNFNVDSDSFEVFNDLANPGLINTGSTSTDCLNGAAYCLVVYNIGQPKTVATAISSGLSANAYLGASTDYDGNIATISAAAVNSLSFNNGDVGPPPWNFGISSPNQRFHIVDTPVSFVCSGGEIRRYGGYPIQVNQPVPPGSGDNLLVDGVTACSFTYDPPTLTRFGLLTIRIEVTEPDSGESASLVQQIHVSNVP